MIDFNKYVKPKEVIVPVINNKFSYNNKQYNINLINDSWIRASISNNSVYLLEKLSSVDIENKNIIKGYVYNNKIIFNNFDVGKRKTGKEIMTNLYLNSVDSFSSIEAVVWEDGKVYFLRPNYSDYLIFEVKQTIDSGENIKNIKGITPELKTLALFHQIENEKLAEEMKKLKEIQDKLEAEEKIKELAKTLEGRLILSFNRVGAELLGYSISGNRITVDWKIGENENQIFNSVIDSNTFSVIEAGYCLSGHDKEHSLHSIILLAKDYDKDDLIYKTRE